MNIDQIQRFLSEYHVLWWGVGLLVIALILVFYFKDVVGRWKWDENEAHRKWQTPPARPRSRH